MGPIVVVEVQRHASSFWVVKEVGVARLGHVVQRRLPES